MGHLLTAAAERALEAAWQWSSCSDSDALGLPELLMGLLAETECRAALMLEARGVTVEDVCRQWPELSPRTAAAPLPRRLADEVVNSFAAAESHLADFPRPLALATEFILLGIIADAGPAGRWLTQQGLDLASVEREIHTFYDHIAGPLAVEPSDDLEDEAEASLLGEVREPAAASRALDSGAKTPAVPSRGSTTAVWRILDAEANRAGEALRVVEDYVRFALDDRHLATLMKGLRHDFAATVSALPLDRRHAARDTQADVGTTITSPAERRRTDETAVVTANLRRAAESLRSLEEFSKTVAAEIASRFETLRYRTYTLERAIDITRTSGERLVGAQLYVLIDGGTSDDAFVALAAPLVEAGVHVLQLRDKQLDDRELLARARLLRSLTRDTDTLFIVNDRPDIAALAEADGVHVGQEELAVKDARSIVGPDRLIGVSTHSIEQARAAVLDGANYIGVGPTFASHTKQFAEFPGVSLLRAVAAEITLPVFAIGGIAAQNLDEVLATGIERVAVSSAVVGASDPAAAAGRLLGRLASVRSRLELAD
ncbi:MAG: thiamine phosphate synthase [Pirellulales bacterium]|nr:thiamine phosphate synthase [Pirellulales bacterium]